MMSREEVFRILTELQSSSAMENVKVGLAGSYSRGEQDVGSDIDIVLNTEITEKAANIELLKYIWKFLDSRLTEKYDLLWLHLLKEEDEELDDFGEHLGIGINEYSVYKNICQDVVWC